MKKITIFILLFLLTGCVSTTNRYQTEFFEIISDELHEYMFDGSDSYSINNEILTASVVLEDYYELDYEYLFEKAGREYDDVVEYYTNLDPVVVYSVDDVEYSYFDFYIGFNKILFYTVFDLDTTDLYETYSDFTTNDFSVWDYVTVYNSYSLLGISNTHSDTLFSELKDFDKMKENYGGYMDADLAAMIMVAIDGFSIEDYLNFILEDLSSTYGAKDYDGEYSCCTTSQVIMAFATSGVMFSNNNLGYVLYDFKNDIGFSNYVGGETDYEYASPQAFLAITVSYRFVLDDFVAFNIY